MLELCPPPSVLHQPNLQPPVSFFNRAPRFRVARLIPYARTLKSFNLREPLTLQCDTAAAQAREFDMSSSEDAPLLTASSRRRGGAVLAAVALAMAGGLAFAAVANRSDTTTSLNVSETIRQNFDVNEDAYAQALAALPASTSQDATNSKGESIIPPLSPEETKNSMMELNSGLHGKVGSIEKWCGAASRRTNAADAATPHPRCRAGFS